MGFGTGVMHVLYACFFVRGLTSGVAGVSSLLIATNAGVSQTVLVVSRGIGLSVGPTVFSRLVGRMLWSGESQSGVTLVLTVLAACGLMMSRAASAPLLYTTFFVMGSMMAALDTICNYLVTRCHGKKAGSKLILYDVAYMGGCLVAPFLTIVDPYRVWDLLAALDLAIAVAVGGRRIYRGKPEGWKRKVRMLSSDAEDPVPPAAPDAAPPLPRAVLHAGMAYIFMAMIVQGSITCWVFTFARSVLGLPSTQAAMLPAAFSLSMIASRVAIVIPASTRLLPSTLCHAGTLITLTTSVLLCYAVKLHAPVASGGGIADVDEVSEDLSWVFKTLLLLMVLFGVGLCSNNSMMLGAMQQHGILDSRDIGQYNTGFCFGNMLGMSFPGIFGLPCTILAGSMCLFLIINGRRAYFPWSEGCLRPPRAP